MGLGSCDVISLKEARELAKAARRLVTLGRDPIEHRKVTVMAEAAERLRLEASTMTFEACAERYLKTRGLVEEIRKHVAQWQSTLASRANIRASERRRDRCADDCIKFLEPIWLQHPGDRIALARSHREGVRLGNGTQVSLGRKSGSLARSP